jgi:hypothetical protein
MAFDPWAQPPKQPQVIVAMDPARSRHSQVQRTPKVANWQAKPNEGTFNPFNTLDEEEYPTNVISAIDQRGPPQQAAFLGIEDFTVHDANERQLKLLDA